MDENELPSEPEPTVLDHTEDDAVLAETQRIRMTAAARLSADKSTMRDPKMANVLIKLMDGADKQVTTKRRIDAMERGNEVSADLASTLDAYVAKLGGGIRRHDTPSGDTYRPEIPDIPSFETKPGELDAVGKEVNVEGIIQTALDKIRANADDQD